VQGHSDGHYRIVIVEDENLTTLRTGLGVTVSRMEVIRLGSSEWWNGREAFGHRLSRREWGVNKDALLAESAA
jgi:hypothetical protein